jgi:hypothetical protein
VWTKLVASASIGNERVDRGRMQGHVAALVELGVVDDQQPVVPVDVAAAERDRCANPQPFSKRR